MSKIRLTQGTIRNIRDLLSGMSVPSSRMKGEWVRACKEEKAIEEDVKGRTKGCFRLKNKVLFMNVLSRYNEVFSHEEWEELLEGDQIDQAKATGNSKLNKQEVMNGFYLNTYDKFPCRVMGKEVPFLQFPEGLPGYIMDWRGFSIPPDVLVIIAENMLNVAMVRGQKYLFDTLLKDNEKNVLVVAYYTPNNKEERRAKALCDWIETIPNRIVHFGDFDLPGINVYLSNYLTVAKGRISFLIPDDIEQRIKNHGSPKRFNDHLDFIGRVNAGDDDRLQWLISIILKYRKGYDHQGYIDPLV